jgi:hypothetical protein
MAMTRIKHNLRIGRADVRADLPAHTPGNRQGNEPGAYEEQPGHLPDGTSTAERSTSINPDKRNPIDPRMPNLSPP